MGSCSIQDGGDRSRKGFWVHFGALERTQVFTGSCGIHFIVIQINTSVNLGHGFKVVPYKKCGYVHEKIPVFENTRFKTLEHLLKSF